MSEQDFVLFQEEEKLRIQQEFAQKRIDLLIKEIEARTAIAEQDGSISQEEQNQIDTLNLQKENLENFVDDAQAERDRLTEQRNKFSLAEFLGVTDEEFEKLQDGLKQAGEAVVDGINQVLDAQAEAVEIRLEQIQEQEDAVRDELDTELALNEAGFASNVAGKQAELANIKKAKQQAQKDAADIAKKQLIVDTITQAQSLITSSIQIIQGFSTIPIIGLPLGIAAVAAMIGFFISAKQKAFAAVGSTPSVAATGASGRGSTGRIHGKGHDRGGEGFTSQIEVQSGEDWGVLSRGASNKHGKAFHTFTEGLNAGMSPQELVEDLLHGSGIYMKKGIDKKIINRGIAVKQQEIIMLANAQSEIMESSLESIDKTTADLLHFTKNKKEYIKTDQGWLEIDHVKNRKRHVNDLSNGTKE